VPDTADRALESWAVADALRSLRPDHRAVLLETYYRGRSVAEAASVLGIPAGTVKSRTFYALKALKLELEEQGLPPSAPGPAGGSGNGWGSRSSRGSNLGGAPPSTRT